MSGSRSLPARALTLGAAVAAALVLAGCGLFTTAVPVIEIPGGDVERGAQLMINYGWVSCHTIPGIPEANTHVGPPLTDWALRRYITGSLPNEPDNLVDFIVNPQAIEPGTAMPTLGVSPEEARDMAAYLYTLD
jgi:cytochrome c2